MCIWKNEVQNKYCILLPYVEDLQGLYTLACAFTTNGWLTPAGGLADPDGICFWRPTLNRNTTGRPRPYDARFSMVAEISFTVCYCIWFHDAGDWEGNNPFLESLAVHNMVVPSAFDG